MSKFIEGISALAPFLAPYPTWVKAICASWICLGAAMIAALILGRPAVLKADPEQKSQTDRSKSTDVWLVIQKLEFFSAYEGTQVRVTADVNGTKFIYPSKAGVEWLEVGVGMSSQIFRLLPTTDRYVIRFEAKVRVPKRPNGSAITGELKSVKDDIIELSDIPQNGRYILHTFDPVHMSRSADANVELFYKLTLHP